MNSLKISKGQSETVSRRRTDNTVKPSMNSCDPEGYAVLVN